MTVIYPASYTKPAADEPLTHSRIAHSENWLSGGTVSVSTTATGYYADAPTNTLTYELWKPSALPAVWSYQHTTSAEVDYMCIAAHTLGSTGCNISVDYSADSGANWTEIISSISIPNDEPIFAIFEPVTGDYFRLNITGSTAPTLGVVKFGKALQMQRPIFGGHAPIRTARQTILRSNYSETGEYLGRSKQRTYHQTKFDWQNLSAVWIGTHWPTLQRAVEAEPFWLAWRPERVQLTTSQNPDDWVVYGGVWSDAGVWYDSATWQDSATPVDGYGVRYHDVSFGMTDAVPIPSNQGVRDLMSVSLSVRARGYD